jgi:hypothetical protein
MKKLWKFSNKYLPRGGIFALFYHAQSSYWARTSANQKRSYTIHIIKYVCIFASKTRTIALYTHYMCDKPAIARGVILTPPPSFVVLNVTLFCLLDAPSIWITRRMSQSLLILTLCLSSSWGNSCQSKTTSWKRCSANGESLCMALALGKMCQII